MIDLEQVQDGISRINDVDVRLVSRPACGIYSAVAPNFFLNISLETCDINIVRDENNYNVHVAPGKG